MSIKEWNTPKSGFGLPPEIGGLAGDLSVGDYFNDRKIYRIEELGGGRVIYYGVNGRIHLGNDDQVLYRPAVDPRNAVV